MREYLRRVDKLESCFSLIQFRTNEQKYNRISAYLWQLNATCGMLTAEETEETSETEAQMPVRNSELPVFIFGHVS